MTKPETPSQSHTILHDLTIAPPVARIFDAITQPEQLVNWWPLKCTGKPELGAEYSFYFGPDYDWKGTVTNVTDNQSFTVKMTEADPDWEGTSFDFELMELSGNVIVRFRHSGWPECNDHFRKSSFCWALLLQGLKDYVEKGKIIPFNERA